MVRRGVRPPSGRIRRGLGTRVLLTCPGPADPRYWGGSYLGMLALLQRWERPCAAQASLRRTQNCATPT